MDVNSIVLVITLVSLCINIPILIRANGTRPFVALVLLVNACLFWGAFEREAEATTEWGRQARQLLLCLGTTATLITSYVRGGSQSHD